MPAHRVDLNGQKFGALTVIGPADDKIDNAGYKHTAWRCVCDCSNHVIATKDGDLIGEQTATILFADVS